MNLYLLRHGLAEEAGAAGADAERALTPEGIRKTWRVAESMEAMALEFDRIFSSPYRRARQTAEIVAEAFGMGKALEMTESLTPGGDFRELVALLNKSRPALENVLLVGHEPYLSGLASLLISGQTGTLLTLKKSGLCKLFIEGQLKHGRCASLEWLLTPRLMRLMT